MPRSDSQFKSGNSAAKGRKTGKRWDDVSRRVELVERLTACVEKAAGVSTFAEPADSLVFSTKERLLGVAESLLAEIEPKS